MFALRLVQFLFGFMLVAPVQAGLPDARVFPGEGSRILLWLHAEQGRAVPELLAADRLAARGVTVWSYDLAAAYFLPHLASSLDQAPVEELQRWLGGVADSGEQATIYAVSRAAVPLVKALARMDTNQRQRLCVLMMYPNLYVSSESQMEASYLDPGRLDGLRMRVMQPRRSAATPWLPELLAHLEQLGAVVSPVVLEDLRERFWARETPTAFELSETARLDEILYNELNHEACR